MSTCRFQMISLLLLSAGTEAPAAAVAPAWAARARALRLSHSRIHRAVSVAV